MAFGHFLLDSQFHGYGSWLMCEVALKGKPNGIGSATASALFHPRCRCRSKNVAEWSL